MDIVYKLTSAMLQRYFCVYMYILWHFRGTQQYFWGTTTVLLRYLVVPETVPNGTLEVPNELAQQYFGRYITVLLLSFFLHVLYIQ